MEVYHSHHQAMANHSQLDDMLGGCTQVLQQQQQQEQEQEKKPRPQPEQALHCPRCDSTNTKFCYYNNYSLSQPRYFCKGCRRYWTQGGTLRNVPVGGGCRKNKRPPSATPIISSAKKLAGDQDLTAGSNNPLLYPSLIPPPPPLQSSDPNDLTLAFATHYKQQPISDHTSFILGNPNPNPNPASVPGFLDGLRNGFVDTTNPSGLHDLCFGWWGNGLVDEREQVLLHTFGSSSTAAVTTSSHGSCMTMDHAGECKMMAGPPAGGDAGLGLEPAREYYWSGGGPFHGLVNSSML